MRLVKDSLKTIPIYEVNKHHKIIWFKGNKPKYKLHVAVHNPDGYVFVNLEDSYSWANGHHKSLESALTETLKQLKDDEYIEIFDTFNDFLKYCKSL